MILFAHFPTHLNWQQKYFFFFKLKSILQLEIPQLEIPVTDIFFLSKITLQYKVQYIFN